jgi:hypothetical protein
MGKINNELNDLENGIIPDSMNFSLDYYIEKKSIATYITFKTFTPEFVENCLDPILINMFPKLYELVEQEYEANKFRTPLEEMLERQQIK